MNNEEINYVSRLNPLERYQYFIKKIADQENFYIMTKDEEIHIQEINEYKFITLWSHREYSLNCLLDEWADKGVYKETIGEINQILESNLRENIVVNVFPIKPYSIGFAVSIEELIRDLNYELEKYL